jgi:hypothetical protein
MLRPRLHVRDPFATQLARELRLAAPGGVLPSLVRQDLPRRAVRRDATPQRLHHKLALLVVRDRVRHQEARVIVHERRDVETLVSTQQEREEVRLPQLVRLRALEASRQSLALDARRRRHDQPRVVQDLSHRVLVHAERLEAREHVADPASAPVGVRSPRLDDRVAMRGSGDRVAAPRRTASDRRHERVSPARLVLPDPRPDRRRRHPERSRRVEQRHAVIDDRPHDLQPHLERIRPARPAESQDRRAAPDPSAPLLRHRRLLSASSADSGQQR